MAGYAYGPPPPPPPTLSASNGHLAYGHPTSSFPHHGHARGAGSTSGRGRGGHYSHGRGDYHAAAAQVHYEYAAQPHTSHNTAPYPASHHAAAYSSHPQLWTHEHGHALTPPATHSHASVAISPVNYHPNYVPQAYTAPSFSQQPSYGPPQQYGNPHQGSSQPSHWNYHGATHQGPYTGGRGRGRYNDRTASKPRPAGPIARQGYEYETGPPVGGSYASPHTHDYRVPHYLTPQYPYGVPPLVAPVHHEGHHGQHHRRGRGGGHRDTARGRGAHNHHSHGGDRVRHNQWQNQTRVMDSKAKTESPSVGKKKKKKRKTNTLGLTPGMDSETEDDEGEEKALVKLIGTETLEISDVAKFLAERRKNFPTKARVEAKKAAELAQKDEDKAASLEKEADRLRNQLRKVESSIKRKREQGDEGDEMRKFSEQESPSDDEKPEVMSSRFDDTAGASLSLPSKANVSRHCKYYSTGGTCGKKGKCRFVHDHEVREAAIKEREANDGRMTIQQRLILNDKEQEDLTILQSIQYLRNKGLMKSVPKSPTGKDGVAQQRQKEAKMDKVKRLAVSAGSLLPAAPASLPEPPQKREVTNPGRRNPPSAVIPTTQSIGGQASENYQGCLLQPYGSTNGGEPVVDSIS